MVSFRVTNQQWGITWSSHKKKTANEAKAEGEDWKIEFCVRQGITLYNCLNPVRISLSLIIIPFFNTSDLVWMRQAFDITLKKPLIWLAFPRKWPAVIN